METLWQDVRYGARRLLKDRAVTLVTQVILGLGIGANTSVFSVLNALVLRPLPVEKQEELVAIYSSDKSGADYGTSGYPDTRTGWSRTRSSRAWPRSTRSLSPSRRAARRSAARESWSPATTSTCWASGWRSAVPSGRRRTQHPGRTRWPS
ncbi:MAG TPA: hypothetical protein VFB95_05640 [Candidatus Cryosericum sp.]|nr:hypothetical protein [Candidatus Cryosericum sp.]